MLGFLSRIGTTAANAVAQWPTRAKERWRRAKQWLGRRAPLPAMPAMPAGAQWPARAGRPPVRLRCLAHTVADWWRRSAGRLRRVLVRTPAPGTLLAVLHTGPLVWYAGPDTYVAATVFRVASRADALGGPRAFLPGPAHLALVRRGVRTAVFGWNARAFGAATTTNVTPATEFGRPSMLPAHPARPLSSTSISASAPTPTPTLTPPTPVEGRISSPALLLPSSSRRQHATLRPKRLLSLRPRRRSFTDSSASFASGSRSSAASDTSSVMTVPPLHPHPSPPPMLSDPPWQPKTAFPAELLARYEAQSRAYALNWSKWHAPSTLVPVATHIVRIPASAGDGYFRLVITHPPASASSASSAPSAPAVSLAATEDLPPNHLTTVSPLFRVFSFSPPLGEPLGAPIWFPPLLLPELIAATLGVTLTIGLGILSKLAPPLLTLTQKMVPSSLYDRSKRAAQGTKARAEHGAASSRMNSTLALAAFGIRHPSLSQLDQEYGRGGVTYWR